MKKTTIRCLCLWTKRFLHPSYWIYALKIICSSPQFIKAFCKGYPHTPQSTVLLDTFIIWYRHPYIFKRLYTLYTKLNHRSYQLKRTTINQYLARYIPVKKVLEKYNAPPRLTKLYLNYLITRQLIDDFKDHSYDKKVGKTTIMTLLDNRRKVTYIRDDIDGFIEATTFLLTEFKKDYPYAVSLVRFYVNWLTLLIKTKLP